MKQPINDYTGKCACGTTASKGMAEGDETQGDLTIKAGEDPGLPEVSDTKKAQKKRDKGGCDRSSAALLARGRSALDQVLEDVLVLSVPAQAWVSKMHSESL